MSAALRLADGMLLVVDVVEGVMGGTERAIKHALCEGLSIILVLNKIDRLALELRLPPGDAYHKLKHTLEEVNHLIALFDAPFQRHPPLSPTRGNVLFASSLYRGVFSLESFAKKHFELSGVRTDHSQFARMLWGDLFFNENTRKFERKPTNPEMPRSFVHFVLEPLYKLLGYTVSEEKETLKPLLGKLRVYLKPKEFKLDVKPLLSLVLGRAFGDTACLVDALVGHVKSAKEATPDKVRRHYTGQGNEDLTFQLSTCSAKGPLCINVIKLFEKGDGSGFDAFGRVISGTVRKGDTVKVLGKNYSPDEEEDMVVKEVTAVSLLQARYRVSLDHAVAGNLVLLDGVDSSIEKSVTVVSAKDGLPVEVFKPLQYRTEATVKIACEPLNPSELPKMLAGLRKISKSYGIAKVKVEESGEHVILGTGELYLDCIMHDLRRLYTDIEIKVSDPGVSFCETVVDTSSFKCVAESANKKNALAMISEPLERGLAEDIERGYLQKSSTSESYFGKREEDAERAKVLAEKYDWDELTASSVWAFGPDNSGPNLLLDYTLSEEMDCGVLSNAKSSVVQGFQWACREGPLCEEPIRGVKFKLMEANLAQESIFRGGGQLIPTARRVAYTSFLTATPRIMEPMMLSEVQCPQDCIEAIYNVLLRRRAHVTFEEPKAGTPLYTLKIEIPGVECFGFETDLRTHTVGQAFVMTHFSHWNLAPGNPLDRGIKLKILEPSPVPELAREFRVTTRRRKGPIEDVNVEKFFDNALMLDMARTDRDLLPYFD